MEQIECSEPSAYKIQTPGDHPEENIQHTEHGESLKSKMTLTTFKFVPFITNFTITVKIINLLTQVPMSECQSRVQ
jgi:hypothetical protein